MAGLDRQLVPFWNYASFSNPLLDQPTAHDLGIECEATCKAEYDRSVELDPKSRNWSAKGKISAGCMLST